MTAEKTPGQVSWTARNMALAGPGDQPGDLAAELGRTWDLLDPGERDAEEAGAQAVLDSGHLANTDVQPDVGETPRLRVGACPTHAGQRHVQLLSGSEWQCLRGLADLHEGIPAGVQEPKPEPGTAYHASITDLRRGIAQEADRWQKRSWEILTQMGGRGDKAPPIVSDARSASLMAGNFGYTLAAVLGAAYREFGPEIGGRLASLADNVITNGDDNDLNADVLPGAADDGQAAT